MVILLRTPIGFYIIEMLMNQPTHSHSSTPSLHGQSFSGGGYSRRGPSTITFEPDQVRAHNSTWYRCSDPSLVGLLTTPAGMGKGRIVIFGGSGGGVETLLSDHFASRGFTSFAIGYHKGGIKLNSQGVFESSDQLLTKVIESSLVPEPLARKLPDHLESINLGKLSGAIQWFEGLDQEAQQPVMLCGVSRGAELALILGSMFPNRFSKILSLLPSNRVNGAFSWGWKGKSDWDKYKRDGWVLDDGITPYDGEGAWTFDRKVRCSKLMRGTISIEKIEAPILALSFKDDWCWGGFFKDCQGVVHKTLQAYFDADAILDPRKDRHPEDVAIVWEGDDHWCYPPSDELVRLGLHPRLNELMVKTWLEIHRFIEPTR